MIADSIQSVVSIFCFASVVFICCFYLFLCFLIEEREKEGMGGWEGKGRGMIRECSQTQPEE